MTNSDSTNKPLNNRRKFYGLGFIILLIIIFLIAVGFARGWFWNSNFLANIPGVEKKLQGEDQDRINILLLGMGGDGHDGPYLTDTIILASLKPSTKEVALFSIPRDLVVPIDNSGNWQKINSINAYAKSNGSDSGLATSQAISKIFNIPINYYTLMDFSGFVNIINDLGGINVDVDNTLDDYAYPILGQEDNPDYAARFKHLHVDKGLQTMNGELALEYTRSRHALGVEGSDFARSKRQQKVIEAVKAKLLSQGNLLNPGMLGQISGQLSQHVKTNLSILEMVRLWSLFKDVNQTNIKNVSFDDSANNYLRSAVSQAGAFILVPKSGDFTGMRQAISNVFGTSTAPELSNDNLVVPLKQIERSVTSTTINAFDTSTLNLTTTTSAEIASSSVEIQNGTHVDGLGEQMAKRLRSLGFTIISINNASQQNLGVNLIYDLTAGAKPEVLAVLKSAADANDVSGLPDLAISTTTKATTTVIINNNQTSTSQFITPKANFILVLGSQ